MLVALIHSGEFNWNAIVQNAVASASTHRQTSITDTMKMVFQIFLKKINEKT